jgi:hypothetical protein
MHRHPVVGSAYEPIGALAAFPWNCCVGASARQSFGEAVWPNSMISRSWYPALNSRCARNCPVSQSRTLGRSSIAAPMNAGNMLLIKILGPRAVGHRQRADQRIALAPDLVYLFL